MSAGAGQFATHHQLRLVVLCLCVLLPLLPRSVQALTPANTTINNQATASYTDAGNTPRTITSNVVQTLIQQVAALTLTSSQSKVGAAGNSVRFAHVLTNTGNGTDSYNLGSTDLFGGAGIDYAFTSINLYPDADGNGIPDSNIAITQSPALEPGEFFMFVAEVGVPASATDGDIGSFSVSASSVFAGGQSAVNTDVVTVSERAVINVSKSLSASSGLAGSGTYRVNLTYSNPSSAIATAVSLIDVLPAGMVYAGNAVWSLGSLSLTDANEDVQGAAPSITYCAYDPSCNTAPFASTQVTLVIDEVGAGQSGSVSFDVSLSATATPGVIFNTANYQYNDSVAVTPLQNSNPAPFTILPSVAVDIVGDTAAPVQPGQTASFTNTISNNGNAIDTFNITLDIAAGNFPLATVFNLYQSDGFTPLLDSNGDGVPDTGPLNPAASTQVVVKAILPPTAAAGSYSVNKIATSENNPAIADLDADSVSVVLPSLAVDLTNNFPRGDANCNSLADTCGFDPGAEAAAQTSLPVLPGNAATFVLYVSNTSSITDSYDLEASTDASFASSSLPAGWSVVYLNDSNVSISNTGPIAPGSSLRVRAVVSVPAGFVAGVQAVYFRILSPVTGAGDIKHDAVDVQVVEDLQMTPDNTGQTTPGSFINYAHTLVNNGNQSENNIQLTAVNSQAGVGWTVAIYADSNGSGVFDAGDNLISTLATLPPGGSQLLFTRIFVPTSAGQSQVNTTTLTATYNGGADSLINTDITTVNRYNVDVVKTQALDADCDGEADAGAGSFTGNTFSVAPGQCVVYQIDTQNNSADQVLNVEVFDATPAYTVYSANQPLVRCVPAVCTFVSEPAANTSGSVHAQVGTLAAGQSVQLYFNVSLEQ